MKKTYRHQGRHRNRSAFTLVELLVVVAIIGLLVAITLPAVNAARESANRAACSNKMRQLVLAAENYHGANGTYPPGRFLDQFGSGPESTAWSWLAMALPFVEEQVLFDQGGIPHSTLKDSFASAAYVETFVCPSAAGDLSRPRADAGNLIGFAVGQTTYKGVSGANWGADKSLHERSVRTSFRNEGTNGSFDGLSEGDGVLWRVDFKHRMSQHRIVDGTSKTFLVGEDLPRHNIWASWPYANNAYGTCAIPPNIVPEDKTWQYESYSFRSDHPGGLNFAMADGSVHFVSEDVDLDVYRSLATRNGDERFNTTDL
jgi:prepilin-type N-terminal cleavage/methylation domain-containing protein/prepilin-type processing-associated H-X9-DG protein